MKYLFHLRLVSTSIANVVTNLILEEHTEIIDIIYNGLYILEYLGKNRENI